MFFRKICFQLTFKQEIILHTFYCFPIVVAILAFLFPGALFLNFFQDAVQNTFDRNDSYNRVVLKNVTSAITKL